LIQTALRHEATARLAERAISRATDADLDKTVGWSRTAYQASVARDVVLRKLGIIDRDQGSGGPADGGGADPTDLYARLRREREQAASDPIPPADTGDQAGPTPGPAPNHGAGVVPAGAQGTRQTVGGISTSPAIQPQPQPQPAAPLAAE
jgi:hypothetical protein